MQTHGSHLPLTGETAFDASHSRLERLLADLVAASDAALAPSLDALQQELGAHFAEEDAALRRLGAEEGACHLDEHAAVLKSLGEVEAALARGNAAVARRFARAVRDWLPEHVQEMDLRLARQLFRQRTGGAPIRIGRHAMAAAAIDQPLFESAAC